MIWQRFRDDLRGNIAVLFAMGFAVSALVGAVAVDAAALYHERRLMQNGVDLAALAAATNPARATELAREALVDAGLLRAGSSDGLTVEVGAYNPDPALPPGSRFAIGTTPSNAVHVSLSRPGTLHFARGWTQSPNLGADALATLTPQVSFSVGSGLASLNGGIANSVLNALLGTNVSLTAMDYNGLLNAQVDLFRFLDALAQELHVGAGTYNDLLSMTANHGQIAGALARVLNGTARNAAQVLAGTAGHNGVLPVGRLLQLGRLGDLAIGSGNGTALFTSLSAFELLSASAALGNGSHQVALSLTAGVPGLVGIDAALAVGEPPQGGSWYAIGPTGTVVRTAQLRLKLVATILGSGALVGVPVRLPLYLELAQSEAIATQATCPTSTNPRGTAVIQVKPGVMRLRVGDVDPLAFGNFVTNPSVAVAKLLEVKLLGLTVLQVLASSLIEIAQTTPVSLPFNSAEINAGTIKTAHVTTPIASLTTSLIDNLNLQVPILGLGLNLTSLRALLKVILTPLAPVLDITISRLLETLGVKVGEADVTVYGVRCTQPVLVG
jgi:uncharacterized membrane protein